MFNMHLGLGHFWHFSLFIDMNNNFAHKHQNFQKLAEAAVRHMIITQFTDCFSHAALQCKILRFLSDCGWSCVSKAEKPLKDFILLFLKRD